MNVLIGIVLILQSMVIADVMTRYEKSQGQMSFGYTLLTTFPMVLGISLAVCLILEGVK